MASINKVILIGHLGKDPEIKFIGENNPVAKFTMATTESYKDKNGEWKDITEWHNIVAWRYLAEKVEKSFKKGMQVFVEGKITSRSYDDKDGVKKYFTEIVASNLVNLTKREGSTEGHTESTSNNSDSFPPAETAAEFNDLPF